MTAEQARLYLTAAGGDKDVAKPRVRMGGMGGSFSFYTVFARR
jgi:hypothetical protein